MPQKKDLGIHEGHRERLKERFRREGIDHFQPHNAIELLLFYAMPMKDTNELAHRLIAHFGSFSAVLEADYNDLCKVKGVGPHVATLLKLIPALGRYYAVDEANRPLVFESMGQIAEFIRPQFIARTKEMVFLFALNSKGALVFGDFIFEGNIHSVAIYTREIMEVLVRTQATAIVLAHNHPGGIAVPSNQDLVATQMVCKSVETMKVKLLDHLIFAGSDYISMRDSHYFE